MDPYAAITEATCGEACWQAREDICRCSCGGKNHGCLRSANGIRPSRTSKIDGFMYELAEGGFTIDSEKALEPYQPRSVEKMTVWSAEEGDHVIDYKYYWHDKDYGSPIRLRTASRSEVQRWEELTAYRQERLTPYLLWKRLMPVKTESEAA